MQNQITITAETLEAFLAYLSESGHSFNSMQTYRQIVTQFYEFLPEEKASARCLWDLHQKTYKDIEDHISVLITQAYEKMLDKEELTVGWNA